MFHQTAALPYRRNADGTVEVLLVTSRSSRRWKLPKGKVPRDMRPHFSAAREAREEAGVVGIASREPIADYEKRKVRRDGSVETIVVRAYPLEVTSELTHWAEMHQRRRKWMSIKRALAKVHDRRLQNVLRSFAERAVCSTR